MNILFLHHNFPAQFGPVAKHYANIGHKVKFMVEKNFVGKIPNIDCLLIKDYGEKSLNKKSQLNLQEECAEKFRFGLEELKNTGYYPDVIISHSGWGCGFFAKSVFPNAYLISYLEWWFARNSPDYVYDTNCRWIKYSKNTINKLYLRNRLLAVELSEADKIICPTKWQLSQAPKWIRNSTQIIHEGVDTGFFKPNKIWKASNKLILTYTTRGMEPIRGFNNFIEVLPCLIREFPNLEVHIAGEDRVAYGSSLPKEGSFGRWAKNLLKIELSEADQERVCFHGRLSLIHYARLLKTSNVHCYLTRPFVVSWSLLEAMATGCYCVVTNIEACSEITGGLAQSVDHRNSDELFEVLKNSLNQSEDARIQRGLQLREQVITHWERGKCLRKWEALLSIELSTGSESLTKASHPQKNLTKR